MTHNPLANPYGYLPPGYQGNIAPNQSQFYPNFTPTQPQATQAMSAPLQISCVVVRSEQEARGYPVAPGNNVIFKNETAPFMYSKTMGNSPFDPPTFEKYRLVKEDETEPKAAEPKEEIDLSGFALKTDLTDYAKKSDLKEFAEQIEGVKRDITALKNKKS